jgi:hypothetical protein
MSAKDRLLSLKAQIQARWHALCTQWDAFSSRADGRRRPVVVFVQLWCKMGTRVTWRAAASCWGLLQAIVKRFGGFRRGQTPSAKSPAPRKGRRTLSHRPSAATPQSEHGASPATPPAGVHRVSANPRYSRGDLNVCAMDSSPRMRSSVQQLNHADPSNDAETSRYWSMFW